MAYVFDPSKPIALGADHAGVAYKKEVIEWLENKGYQVKDFGTQILRIRLQQVLKPEKQLLVFYFVALQMV
jgi:hypothetical protein